MYYGNWKHFWLLARTWNQFTMSGNYCDKPIRTHLSPHGTICLSLGKIHAHIRNGHKQVRNTFLDDGPHMQQA